jgi:hypothetical protein
MLGPGGLSIAYEPVFIVDFVFHSSSLVGHVCAIARYNDVTRTQILSTFSSSLHNFTCTALLPYIQILLPKTAPSFWPALMQLLLSAYYFSVTVLPPSPTITGYNMNSTLGRYV